MTDETDAAAAAARKADRLRAWKAAHPEKVKQYRDKARTADPDAYRAKRRAEYAAAADRREAERTRERADEQRRRAARERAREWYAHNRERHLEYQRQYRERKRAEDPEAYRAAKRARTQRWRAANFDRENAKLRAKYRADPDTKRAQAARYYAAHADQVRARRREYYADHRDQQLAAQRVWREREKRRREAGLPPRRLHRVAAAQREAHAAEASTFFSRARSPEQLAALRAERATPATLLAAWHRDAARARAAHHHATTPPPPTRESAAAAHMARERENARLDAIARAINDQLRRPAPSPRGGANATPTAAPAQTRGLTR